MEKKEINFHSDNSETYNQPFTLTELQNAFKKTTHNTAVGPDEIHYEFLKQLPRGPKKYLLKIYNDIWTTGKIPNIWKQATIIPMPKPSKTPTDPMNYRPIALTSCVCKTFERMVNKRLVWYLEKKN